MLKEIEKLLREIAEQQGGTKPTPQSRPQNQPSRSPRNWRDDEDVVDAVEVIEAEPVNPLYEDVSEHVRGHINTGEIAERTSRLGYDVGQADERLEAHIHDAFDHDLSQLDDRPGISDDESQQRPVEASIASEIAGLLGNPNSVRQAIILSEVLQRPEHRW